MQPTNLRCEYLTNPRGLDVRQPRLSWWPPVDQAGYQIVVSRGSKKVWDTGRVASDESLQIAYAGPVLQSRGQYQWRVRVWPRTGRVSRWSEPALWTMGILTTGWQQPFAWDQPHTAADQTAWIGGPTDAPAMVRRRFQVKHPVRQAFLYATALGVYEVTLNGRQVGERRLAPEWTDYRKRVQYQTYEVTTLLWQGVNTIIATLAPGWFAGRIGLLPGRRHYGHRLRFFARLYADDEQVLGTGSGWQYADNIVVTSADTLDGERQDGRRKPVWKPVLVEECPAHGRLVAQINEPIRVTQELRPVQIVSGQRGTFIVDLGQNMVGTCRLTLRQTRRGQRVQVRHAEVLNDDGTPYFDNLRGAPAIDRYVCRGAPAEVFEPRFTYHGFRYVEVTGVTRTPEIVGRVFHSAAPAAGAFECSSPLLNRIFKAIQWTQRGNLMSVPTDCPQRDERLGWMGDIQVFSQTAIFNSDLAAFFTKFCRDMRDGQAADGRFPDFAPIPHGPEIRFAGNPGWADAGVIIPWRQWVNYGDRRLLAEHFDAMCRYIDGVDAISPDHLWRDFGKLTPLTCGDWLNSDTFEKLAEFPQGKGECPKDLYATAFFAHSTGLLAQMARVLASGAGASRRGTRLAAAERRRAMVARAAAAGYATLARQIRTAFVNEFVSRDGRLKGDTQAGYALALSFDLLPARLRPLAARHLVRAMKPFGGHLSTGIQSTVRAMLELTRWGYADIAYELINKTTIPSWGYMVEHGGTTIWERWDGYVQGRGYQQPGMNSFNHYAIGAVGEWMYRVILGLNPDEAAPGWKHFLVRPIPGGGLSWARGEYRSVRGPISVEWHQAASRFKLTLAVPPNTTATVELPNGRRRRVGSGIHRFG